MTQCTCQQSNVVPDFTAEGFAGQKALASVEGSTATNTAESLHQQLASQGVLALDISACVAASYNNGKVCFSFPVIGNLCVNIPVHIPLGAQLKVCGKICTKFVMLTGLQITLYLNNNPVGAVSSGARAKGNIAATTRLCPGRTGA